MASDRDILPTLTFEAFDLTEISAQFGLSVTHKSHCTITASDVGKGRLPG